MKFNYFIAVKRRDELRSNIRFSPSPKEDYSSCIIINISAIKHPCHNRGREEGMREKGRVTFPEINAKLLNPFPFLAKPLVEPV